MVKTYSPGTTLGGCFGQGYTPAIPDLLQTAGSCSPRLSVMPHPLPAAAACTGEPGMTPHVRRTFGSRRHRSLLSQGGPFMKRKTAFAPVEAVCEYL